MISTLIILRLLHGNAPLVLQDEIVLDSFDKISDRLHVNLSNFLDHLFCHVIFYECFEREDPFQLVPILYHVINEHLWLQIRSLFQDQEQLILVGVQIRKGFDQLLQVDLMDSRVTLRHKSLQVLVPFIDLVRVCRRLVDSPFQKLLAHVGYRRK